MEVERCVVEVGSWVVEVGRWSWKLDVVLWKLDVVYDLLLADGQACTALGTMIAYLFIRPNTKPKRRVSVFTQLFKITLCALSAADRSLSW